MRRKRADEWKRDWLSLVTVAAAVIGASSSLAKADSVPWEVSPKHVGRALPGAGWMDIQELGTVNGSPEFTFPLQLIYLSFRGERGFFGDQWFCPQLESNVLPKQKGVLVWQTPERRIYRVVSGSVSSHHLFDEERGYSRQALRPGGYHLR